MRLGLSIEDKMAGPNQSVITRISTDHKSLLWYQMQDHYIYNDLYCG